MFCKFLVYDFKATGTGMQVKRALMSKDTEVSGGAVSSSLQDSANLLLSLTNTKLLPQYG